MKPRRRAPSFRGICGARGLALALIIAFVGARLEADDTPPPSAAERERGGDEPIVRRDVLRVRGRPITCFGLHLRLFVSPTKKQIVRLLVERVAPDSEAESRNVRSGAEILKADGRDVRAMQARFDPASEFGRLFVNRKRGDSIRLELRDTPDAKPREIILTHTPGRYTPYPWEQWEDAP